MPELTYHYDDTIKVEFDVEAHVYTVSHAKGGEWTPPRKVNSVTTPINEHSPKPWLAAWAYKVGAEAAYAEIAKYEGVFDGRFEYRLDPAHWESVVKAFKSAHRTRLRSAGDIGTQVHRWAELWALATIPGSGVSRGEPMPDHPEAKLACQAFLEWVERNSVVFEHVEKRIYSREHDYAGTVDFIGWVNGEHVVADLKTSGHINQGYHIQTAAYAAAYMEEFPNAEPFAKRLVLRLPKDGDPFEISESDDPQDFDAFLLCLKLYRYTGMKDAAAKAAKKLKKEKK